MRVSLVVAIAENGVIGRDNALPWRLPDEMAHFRKVTMGHPLVMGRRTYESIGKPLPGRTNIVVTRNPHFQAPGCIVVTSLQAALDAAAKSPGADEVCVMGGTSLFEEAFPVADVLHLTEVQAAVPGDTFFPPFDRSAWVEHEVARHPADARHAYPFRILRLERRR